MILVIDMVIVLAAIFCMVLILGTIEIVMRGTTALSLHAGILVYVLVIAVIVGLLSARASVLGASVSAF